MARITSNRIAEDLNNGTKRDTKTDAPAIETEHARFAEVGIFRQSNVAASQSAVALKVGGIDSDNFTGVPAHRAGVIVGITWALTAAATHTAGTIQATVGGTAKGTAVNIDGGGTAAVTDQSTPIAFTEGALLGVNVTTDANWLPVTTDLAVWLLVRWTA